MELILPIIIAVSVLVLGGREVANAPSRPEVERQAVHERHYPDNISGCEAAPRTHRDLTVPYPQGRDQTSVERCGGDL